MKTYANDKKEIATKPDFQRAVTKHAAQLHDEPSGIAVDMSAKASALKRHQQLARLSPQTAQLEQRARMIADGEASAQLRAAQLQLKEPTQRVEDEELLQGKFDSVQRMEEEELLQGKFEPTPAVLAAAVQEEERPNNTGLPNQLKSGIESLSGFSMDHVKVHYNSDKPAQLQAHAYAQGSEIHVAPGQEKHLPHEAWHVVQQAQGRVKPTLQMQGGVGVNDDASLEGEADLMGQEAMSRQGPAPESMKSGSQGSATSPVQAVFVNDMGWHLSDVAKGKIMAGTWEGTGDKAAFLSQFNSDDEAKLDEWMEGRGDDIYENVKLNDLVSGQAEEEDWVPAEEEESEVVANERANVENAIRTAAVKCTKKDNSGHGGGKTIPKGTKGDRHEVGQRRKDTRKKALSNRLDHLLEHYVELGGDETTMDSSTKKLLKAAGWTVPSAADEV
jgi:hypothetical protein